MIRRSTLVVVVVFFVLLGLLWLQQNRQPDELEATPTPEAQPVIQLAISDLAGLKLVGPDGSAFYATRDSAGNWTLVQPSVQGELDSSLVDSNLAQILTLRSLTNLDPGIGLEAVGLVTPQYVIRLQLVDGREILLAVGDETPTKSGYYVRVNNNEVVVAQAFTIQSVVGMLDTLPVKPTPTPVFTETPADSTAVPETPTPTP